MADVQDSEESLIDFPCEFPVKIMGRAGDDFEGLVFEIVRRHAPEIGLDNLSVRASRDGNFIAVTAIIVARSRRQLDDLYEELSTHERVLMAL
jgi:hypothetical protein